MAGYEHTAKQCIILIRTDETFWPISAPFIHRKPTIEARRKIMCGNNPLSLHYHIIVRSKWLQREIQGTVQLKLLHGRFFP
jgi:hypothetical protein